MPDELFGEVPAAVYMAKPDKVLHPDALCAFLRIHLAPFKVPVKAWEVTEALPRLGTEKVDKRALRTRYTEEWQATNMA